MVYLNAMQPKSDGRVSLIEHTAAKTKKRN